MFSEWNILNVEGQQGQKTAETVETTTPLAKLQSLQTAKEQGQGKVNAGAEEILSGECSRERQRDPPKQESAQRYACRICLVLAFCLTLSARLS